MRLAYGCEACAPNCADNTYQLDFSGSCPKLYEADITSFIIAPTNYVQGVIDGGGTFDWNLIANWTANINTGATDGGIRYFDRVCGGMDRVNRPFVERCGLRLHQPFPFSFEIEVVDFNQTNHLAFQKMQGCPTKYDVWWETGDHEFLWGLNNGVNANVSIEPSGPEGGYISYFIVVSWEAHCMPSYIDSPFS